MGEKRRSRVFPSDLAPELLLRLPAKSLSRFRCVCKSWDDLISESDFGKQHRARFLPNPALLTCLTRSSVHDDNDDDDDPLSIPAQLTFHIYLFDSEGTLVRKFAKRTSFVYPFVISTCRHLLLTSNFVLNIATQEVVITLPPCFLPVELGHVPSTNEFKVLALDYRQAFKVLTLGTHQWRDVGAASNIEPWGVFANGAIHIVRKKQIEIDSFNLEREEWGVVAGPPLTHPNYDLRELNGYLCKLDGDDINNTMDIWLLKDYDKGLWVKQYTVCLFTLKASTTTVNLLLIEDDGRLLVQVDEYSLQLYDPKTQCYREIQRFEEMEDAQSFFIKCFSSLGHRD